MSNTLPNWCARIDAHPHPSSQGFHDFLIMMNHHFRLHQSIDQFLGPYNARQRNNASIYRAPDKDTLKQCIKKGSINDFTYSAALNSIIRFCEEHKGQRSLPAPHPSTIHSIQLPLPAFELVQKGNDTEVHVIGIEHPLIVRGLKNHDQIKFIIIRPKLSRLGTASSQNWEVLFFRTSPGFIPDWVDSQLNPKYSGLI